MTEPWHKKLKFYAIKFRRDIWLFLITGFVLYSLVLSRDASNDTARAVDKINQERVHNILTSCQETNARHDDTVDQLNRILLGSLTNHPVPPSDKGGPTPAQVSTQLAGALRVADTDQRSRLTASLASTILLINALAPKHVCADLVKQQVPSATSGDD